MEMPWGPLADLHLPFDKPSLRVEWSGLDRQRLWPASP